MTMDDIQEKSLKSFYEALEGTSEEELNDIIEEINNLDNGDEPTIDEYFNQDDCTK